MSQILDTFWGEATSPGESESVAILQHFETEEATEAQAKKLHREVLAQIGNVFATLRRIHATRAYKQLGCSSFPEYLDSLKKQSEAFQIDHNKFYRLLRHDDVCDRLLQDGVNKFLVGNLKESHTDILHAELPETLWVEAIDRLIENKAAHKPVGKAAEFDHMFKFTAEMVRDAVARVNQRIASELPSDPFDDSVRQIEPVAAIFDATDDGRIKVDDALAVPAPEWVGNRATIPATVAPKLAPNLRELAPKPAPVGQKPLPPLPPEPQNVSILQQNAPSEIALAFEGMEEAAFEDVIYIYGTDGHERYAIPVRMGEIERFLRERGE